MNRLFMVFIFSIFSISLFFSCDMPDPYEIEIQKNIYWYSFTDDSFEPIPINPSVLSSEITNEILEVYLTETNKNYGWNLTIDEVGIEKYYGTYSECIAVILFNKYIVPREEEVYIKYELEIVVDGVSFLYGPVIGGTIEIYDNGKLYSMQEAYDKGLLKREDLKNIAYYQNEGFILPERTDKSPIEEKILWSGNINEDFDDRTLLIVTDKNYNSWRFLASDFTDVNVVTVQSLMVQRLMRYPNYDSGDIISIGIGNPGKKNVIDAIRKLEKLDFIKWAGPNHVMYFASD